MNVLFGDELSFENQLGADDGSPAIGPGAGARLIRSDRSFALVQVRPLPSENGGSITRLLARSRRASLLGPGHQGDAERMQLGEKNARLDGGIAHHQQLGLLLALRLDHHDSGIVVEGQSGEKQLVFRQ